MEFENKWVEEAVRKVLGISAEDPISSEALGSIKYVKIGASLHFINGFEVQLSTQTPPEPFSDTDGGDEWICCLRGKNIEAFLNQENKRNLLLPSRFGFDNEDFMGAQSDEAEALWEEYKKSLVAGNDFMTVLQLAQAEGKEATDKRFDSLMSELYRDIVKFKGVQVLRIDGLSMPDYHVFEEMKQLKVLELVEVNFASFEGYECLMNLQQFACWMD